MTITIGAWIVPLMVTIAAFAIASWSIPTPRGDYAAIGTSMVGLIYLLMAAGASLFVWLLWALIR